MPKNILQLAAGSIRSSALPHSLPRIARSLLRPLSSQASLLPRMGKSWVPGRSRELEPSEP